MRQTICSIRFRGFTILLSFAVLGFSIHGMLWGDDADPVSDAPDPANAKDALAEFNDLIGGWRGTGQPRRGSNRGAWREDAEWIWEFNDDDVSIRYDVTDGKLMTTAQLTYDVETGRFQLTAEIPESGQRVFTGRLDGDSLELNSELDADGYEHRITVTRLNDKRTLVLFENRREGRQSFSRVAEVGYTREGTRLATTEGSGPECVVTGGAGTMPVTHNGRTYYVCCSGCRQAFEDDPEGVIAEYEAKLAERRAAAGVAP